MGDARGAVGQPVRDAAPPEFEQFGLPSTFISDFKTLVDRLPHAADVRLSSKTVRRKATAGISTALEQGLDAARDLDVIVAIATRLTDPATFAAWTTARRIEGLGGGTPKIAVTLPVPEPIATPVPQPPAPAPSVGELEKASWQRLGGAAPRGAPHGTEGTRGAGQPCHRSRPPDSLTPRPYARARPAPG